jgi:glycine cleavage system aminomethyltransferase T
MYLSHADQPRLFDALRAEGAAYGLALVGLRSLMMLRLEKSYAAWGSELTSDYCAHECGMMPHVKLDKGDFVGREAARNYGPARERPITLTVEADDCAIWGDESIFLGGKPVGYVSSGGWGPAIGKHIALGYVQPDAWLAGGRYEVEILGKLRPAVMHEKPLYDPTGSKMRA